MSAPETATDTGGGAWSNSFVWKSFKVQEWEKFARLQKWQAREDSQVRDSPFIPSSFKAYVSHRIAVLEAGIQALKLRIAARKEMLEVEKRAPAEVLPIFGGKDLGQATELLSKAIPPITVSDVLSSRCFDADAEFVEEAEFRLGEGLLKEL